MRNVLFFILVSLVVAGCRPSAQVPEAGIYTSPAATLPQLPLLVAQENGLVCKRMSYRSPAQLQALLLAGQGEAWLGSLELFARARKAGAPIRIAAVTGWRKWYLIGRGEASTWREALQTSHLETCPPGNPAALFLQEILRKTEFPLPAIIFSESRLLMMRVLNGQENLALIAEPLASNLLAKDGSLRRIAALEDIKSEVLGGEARLPWAGFAFHELLSPDRARQLLDALLQGAQASQEECLAVWPQEFHDTISTEMLHQELERSKLLALPAFEIESEIQAFLEVVAPDIAYDTNLLFRSETAASTTKEIQP